MKEWFATAGLSFEKPTYLEGGDLTVVLWTATRMGNLGAHLDDDAVSPAERVHEQVLQSETAILDEEKVT